MMAVRFYMPTADHGVPEAESHRITADITEEPGRFQNQVGDRDRDTVEQLYSAAYRGQIVPQ